MKDTIFASYLLHHKEQGYSIMYVIRKSAIRYLILFFALVFFILLYHARYIVFSGFVFIIGLVIGAIARDVGWFRQSRRLWPFYDKVIDWSKVRQIAEGKTSPASSGENEPC